MISQNKDWFKYDGYWKTWSRVITRMGGDRSPVQIEITIHPGDLTGASSWEEVKELKLRRHRTKTDITDVWTHHLPDNIYNEIVETLGDRYAQVLVHTNILPMLSPGFHDRGVGSTNGGVPLREICCDISAEFILTGEKEGVGHRFEITKAAFMEVGVKCVGIQTPDHILPIGGLSINNKHENIPSFTMFSYYDVKGKAYVAHFSITDDGDNIFTVRSEGSPSQWGEAVLKALEFVWDSKSHYPWVIGVRLKEHLKHTVTHAEYRFNILNVI